MLNRISSPVSLSKPVSVALLAAVIIAVFVPSASALATRTWVSGVGDDVNPCSRTAPCKTLAGAISKTNAGGEINAIDPGGFGAVTITKAITIDLSGPLGSVLNTGTNGIIINAAASDDIVLRGIDITGGGGGVAPCTFTAISGIKILAARSVLIESLRINQTMTSGIELIPDTTDVSVMLNHVDIRNSCGAGINVAPTSAHKVSMMVRDSTISTTATALHAGDGAHVWITGSTIFANTLGFDPVGTGIIDSHFDTHVFGNVTNGSPTTVFGVPFVLLYDMPRRMLRSKIGKPVDMDYITNLDATSTLTVTRGATVVATVADIAESGKNTITWNGKIGTAKAPKGTYKLSLRCVSADGQVARTTARVRVRKR